MFIKQNEFFDLSPGNIVILYVSNADLFTFILASDDIKKVFGN